MLAGAAYPFGRRTCALAHSVRRRARQTGETWTGLRGHVSCCLQVASMGPPSTSGSEIQQPVLVAHVARADGSGMAGLRVYCPTRARTIDVDICRACPRCHEISEGEGGKNGWVRCTPESPAKECV